MTYSFRFVPFRLRLHSLPNPNARRKSGRQRVAEGRSRFVLAPISIRTKGGYGIVLLRCVAITMVLIKSKLEIGRGACVLIGVMAHNCTSAIVVIH